MTGINKKLYLTSAVCLLIGLPFGQSLAEEGPAEVTLDTLAQYYEPVIFDHNMHVSVTGNDCAICHHHTADGKVDDDNCRRCHANSGKSDKVACRECHSAKRFEAEYLAAMEQNNTLYHVGKPGLKGAYHQKCLGCHKEMGAPEGCSDCHVRNDLGDQLFRAGQYAPHTVEGNHGH